MANKVDRIERFLEAKNSTQQEEKIKFLTLSQLCAYMPGNPSKSTIYAKVSRREIPHKKVNGKLLFKKTEIDSWVNQQSRSMREERIENLLIKRRA